ncbi:hypothetical protein DPMN_113089 [Dreissena polymorpha]|uniref:Uncharacterized protein n=1 Tax=Dreissena polymorpha TaxID=45954 RepID=A0A9D4QR94_DREPO|nr:hypothetical protein DPMN_113089 [Dreissena polymorpha]
MNLDTSHQGARELLERNGFSVSRSPVPKSRNPVDITIEHRINRHAKCHGGIIGFSRNYSAYYRWSTTRPCRAQYVEAALQMTDMASEDCSVHKELEPSQLQDSKTFVTKVVDALCNFTNPFDVENALDELYCLSSGVPAIPEAAVNLLEAVYIGRAAM